MRSPRWLRWLSSNLTVHYGSQDRDKSCIHSSPPGVYLSSSYRLKKDESSRLNLDFWILVCSHSNDLSLFKKTDMIEKQKVRSQKKKKHRRKITVKVQDWENWIVCHSCGQLGINSSHYLFFLTLGDKPIKAQESRFSGLLLTLINTSFVMKAHATGRGTDKLAFTREKTELCSMIIWKKIFRVFQIEPGRIHEKNCTQVPSQITVLMFVFSWMLK